MKVSIWGTGNIAKGIGEHLVNADLLGYIETEKSRPRYNDKPVYSAEERPQNQDAVIIAVSSVYHRSILASCRAIGIDEDKLCFMKNSGLVPNVKRSLEIAHKIFDKEFYESICREFGEMPQDWIEEDARKYETLNTRDSLRIVDKYRLSIYDDKFSEAGGIGSYFWQDLWAARKIYQNAPEVHYDIGSRIDGFIAHLLTFRAQVNLIDIRPLDGEIEGLEFTQSDATNLVNIRDDSIESLSALCSLEHFGLGRYGDEIDPEACFKCFQAIQRKMKSGGDIYISVPIGKEHVEFNAHRVFYASTIVKEFWDCKLVEFSTTKDGSIEYDVDIERYDDDISLGGNRFGLFHFQKK